MENQAPKRLSSDLENQDSREQNKKMKGSLKPTDSSWICSNVACRATQSSAPRFCKRCTCCICQRFDNDMDPTLWLKCSPESDSEGSCGYSCHVECALQHGKVGVLQLQLDGCYSCAYCGKVSSIIGCWKEQLKVALRTNRIDVLCYRIILSYRLLNGTSKFSELHKFIEDVKAKLEMEVGPLNVTTGKMSRPHAGRFHAASHVQALCRLAVKKAEELMSSNSSPALNLNAIPVAEGSFPSSVPPHKSRAEQKSTGVGDAQPQTRPLPLPDLNIEFRGDDTKPNTAPPTKGSGSGGLGDGFENIVKTICMLEHDRLISEQFRLKFLTWFSMKAREHERRIVRTFVQTIDDPSCLAGQLVDTFSDIIFNNRS